MKEYNFKKKADFGNEILILPKGRKANMLHSLVEIDIEQYHKIKSQSELLTATVYGEITTALVKIDRTEYLHIEVNGRPTKIFKIVKVR